MADIEPGAIWDIYYAEHRKDAGGRDSDLLMRWKSLWRVIATDIAREALRITRSLVPQASVIQLDIGHGLPFLNGAFGMVVANLSLHYFSWRQTQEIIADIWRCIQPGGFLIARLNSKSGMNSDAKIQREIESDYYEIDLLRRRYFDQGSLEKLFCERWQIRALEEQSVHPYGERKVVWGIVSQKAAPHGGAP
jgi:SAM-dependent methyltransferase